ncbi:MAG: hypothetical protein SFT94_09055 [Pseudanabaenaceae cyanobacterium bins.68]|nr:hypothetical protein [Pseudanabaenaceae cyanobacterium bins.68]
MSYSTGIVYGLVGIALIPALEAQTQIQPESSPLLQRWLNDPPNLLEEIRHHPSFNTKLGLEITTRNSELGFRAGLEDLFLGRSPVSLSTSYGQTFRGSDRAFDLGLRYYILPLGEYFNFAPQVGYRSISSQTSGLDLGFQAVFALSPRSADLRLGHTWTALGTNQEISTTRLAASYGVLAQLRLASSIQWQRSPQNNHTSFGIGLEWSF